MNPPFKNVRAPTVSSGENPPAKQKQRDARALRSYDLTMHVTLSIDELLHAAPWMDSLTDCQRGRVMAQAYETQHPARAFVARQGEAVHSWLGVADGLLKISAVSRGGKQIMFTGVPEGSWVGEGSVMKDEARRYDVIAVRSSRVIHIPMETFRWLLKESMGFCHFILRHLNERAGQCVAMAEVVRVSKPSARLAGGLCLLFNPVIYPRTVSLLNISQEEMGELVGLSRPSANAAVRQLEALRLVQAEYGMLRVLDFRGLQDHFYQGT
ncbi:MAG: Crp/Fnr family transcriptional regulator [Comamonadaceae bacterium]|nr:MAG: Crp/Fnr family transcriptional regulator [Comamonadaceae bacterium]